MSLVTPIRASRPATTTTEKTSSVNPIIVFNNEESTPLIESKASALVSNDNHHQSRYRKTFEKQNVNLLFCFKIILV